MASYGIIWPEFFTKKALKKLLFSPTDKARLHWLDLAQWHPGWMTSLETGRTTKGISTRQGSGYHWRDGFSWDRF